MGIGKRDAADFQVSAVLADGAAGVFGSARGGGVRGGEGGGESAEGESEGESAEGESEGEAAEGEAPEAAPADDAAAEIDPLDAYKAYMTEWLMAEFEVNDTMTEDNLPEFQACIDANDYSQFPGDMFFNGMLENGNAMTFDEFVAAMK